MDVELKYRIIDQIIVDGGEEGISTSDAIDLSLLEWRSLDHRIGPKKKDEILKYLEKLRESNEVNFIEGKNVATEKLKKRIKYYPISDEVKERKIVSHPSYKPKSKIKSKPLIVQRERKVEEREEAEVKERNSDFPEKIIEYKRPPDLTKIPEYKKILNKATYSGDEILSPIGEKMYWGDTNDVDFLPDLEKYLKEVTKYNQELKKKTPEKTDVISVAEDIIKLFIYVKSLY